MLPQPSLNTPRRPWLRVATGLASRSLYAIASLLLCASAGAAVKYQSLEEIRAAVLDYVKREYQPLGKITDIEINQLDPRLNLPACEQPLSVAPLAGQRRAGNATFGVRCDGARPWTVYVPVRIASTTTVMTAATALARGTVLKESDLVPIQRDTATLPHGYFTRAEDLVGMELRRPLRPGEIVSQAAVTVAAVVARGQQVLLVVDDGAVTVSMKGEALEDGAPGERIQVRNLSSRRVIQGEVLDRHRVKVAL